MNAVTNRFPKGNRQTRMACPYSPRYLVWPWLLWLTIWVSDASPLVMAASEAKVERFGEIEVEGHARMDREMNTGGLIGSQSWSLRWRGEPLIIDSFGGMGLDEPMRTGAVNAIFVVGDGAVPDLLVHVGDPNNASVFHLLRQEGGQLSAPVLCKTFGGENGLRVLAGQGAGTAFSGPNYRVLNGARQVLLGNACVYDVASRRAGAIPRLPMDVFAPYAPQAIMFSPDGRSVARLALTDTNQQPMVAVAELGGQEWRLLPIDPARMRFALFENIDADWMLHHFEWLRGKDGLDRLVERAHFTPLPRRGTYGANMDMSYRMPNLAADQTEAFFEFLARFPGSKRLPDFSYEHSDTVEHRFEIEGERVTVMEDGFYVATGAPYWPGQPGDPKLSRALLHRLGDAFEAEVAKGMHEAMFVAPSIER